MNPQLKPLFDIVCATPRPEFTGEFVSSAESVYVPRHYWARTNKSGSYPVIFARGASDGVLLGLHNPESGVSVIGSMNSTTLVPSSVQKMINAARGSSNAPLCFGMASGVDVQEPFVERILVTLRQNKIDICAAGNISLVTRKNKLDEKPSLGIDSRDGTYIGSIGWDAKEDESYHPVTSKMMDARLDSFRRWNQQALEEVILAR